MAGHPLLASASKMPVWVRNDLPGYSASPVEVCSFCLHSDTYRRIRSYTSESLTKILGELWVVPHFVCLMHNKLSVIRYLADYVGDKPGFRIVLLASD